MRRRTQAKRDALLDAAMAVFVERGFAAASLTEISARHGGSKQTLYNYFASKEGLFRALVVERAASRWAPLLTEFAAADSLQIGLRGLAAAHLEQITAPEALGIRRLIVAEGHKNQIGAIFFEAGPGPFLDELARLLAAHMRRGDLRSADPAMAARHLISLLESGPYQWLLAGVLTGVAPNEASLQMEGAVQAFERAYAADEARDIAHEKTRPHHLAPLLAQDARP